MPAGRPSMYTQELADEICARIADGQSLRTICRDAEMPAMTTVFKWRREKQEFEQCYARAKDDCADALAEEILEISDDSSDDWEERERKDGSTYEALNKEAVMRSRLRVDSRKWIAAKLKPKRYGDTTRHEMTGPDGGPIQVEDKTIALKLVSLLNDVRHRMIEGTCVDITDQQALPAPDDGSDLL